MSSEIPKQFDLLNTTITVKWHDDPETLGKWYRDRAEIALYKDQCSEVLLHTFCHELWHAILDLAGYPDLSENEGLVDVCGGLTAQFMSTADYEEDDDDTDSANERPRLGPAV